MTEPQLPPPVLSPDGRFQWLDGQWQSVEGTLAPPAKNEGKAIASLVLSILWVGGFGSIAGVVLGHLSRGEARREGRNPSGLAMAGLILGYIGVAVLVVGVLAAIAIPVFLNQREKDDAAQAKSELREVATLEESYSLDAGTYTLDLTALQGYTVAPDIQVRILSADADRYCISATPVKGTKSYYYASDQGLVSTPCS